MAIVINGSGTVTGISVGGLPDDIVDSGTLADDAVGLAQMAAGTDGNVITYDASGNPAVVASGSSGQILTSAGAGAAPTMATLSAGKVLQVKYVVFTTSLSIAGYNSTFAAFNETLDITPTAASSKIYAFCNIHVYINLHSTDGWSSANIQLFRDSTRVANSDQATPSNTYAFGRHTTSDTDRMMGYFSKNFEDSPSSTSTLTYSIKAHSKDVGPVRYNEFGASNMILMEVAG
jgi:hypothetical protein